MLCIIGVIVISKDVDAVLGIAKSGPIVKQMMIKNNIENLGEILFNAPIYPSLSSAPTITPNNGKPIPVRTNAKMAGQKN